LDAREALTVYHVVAMKRFDTRHSQGTTDPSEALSLPPPGSRVHLLGICGTGMTALAGLLLEKGYRVSGSDSHAYPPMSDLLAGLGIPVALGYDPDHLDLQPDLVIIGNVIRRENPEARAVLSRGLRYLSFPKALAQFCLAGRTPLVVAGTHGKTTTASLLVSTLAGGGEDPGFMIGGVVQAYGAGFHLGRPPWFVLEGDEYDTAFFDKGNSNQFGVRSRGHLS
jgi:UDP-N-acetylmuramate: L-alanyl-gamma-D-glutamyl-meso-diaminopimelate ligase